MNRVHKSLAIDLSGDDVTIPASFGCSAIYVGSAGTVKAKLRGDAEPADWIVGAGAAPKYLLGDFETVLSTANGTTADDLIAVSDI